MKKNIRKILIMRLSSMGDVVLASPLIRCVRNQIPNATIDFVVDKKYSDVIKYNPHINNLIEYDRDNPDFNAKIKENLDRNYEIIDLQNNRRSKLFRKKIGKIIGAFNKYRLKKIALVWVKKNYFGNTNIPERYIATAQKINIKDDKKGLEVWLPEENNLEIYPPENKIYSNAITKITLVPSATHFTKRWLPEYFVKLIDMLNIDNCEFNLIGDAKDKQICNYIISHSNNKINIIDHSSKTTILDAVRIIDKSDLVISNDTGMMHIASARRVRVIAIYGSTVPAFGFIPFRTPHRICEIELSCRPCTHIGKQKCHKKHFNCMRLITPEMVCKKALSVCGNLILKVLFVALVTGFNL